MCKNNLIAEVADKLRDRSLALCQIYLSNGYQLGNTWVVGSINNDKGKSFVVNVSGPKRGYCYENSDGTDCDIFEVIHVHENKANKGLTAKFASEHLLNILPVEDSSPKEKSVRYGIGEFYPPKERIEKNEYLFSLGKNISGTLAELYLKSRLISELDYSDFRFLNNCYYRNKKTKVVSYLPAMLAAIRGPQGEMIAVHRTYLGEDGSGKANVEIPKQVTNDHQGYGVAIRRVVSDTFVLGEGIETMASFSLALPDYTCIAGQTRFATSRLRIPKSVKKVILAKDQGGAGNLLKQELLSRCLKNNIEFIAVSPINDDFNSDHMQLGFDIMKNNILSQIN